MHRVLVFLGTKLRLHYLAKGVTILIVFVIRDLWRLIVLSSNPSPFPWHAYLFFTPFLPTSLILYGMFF
jgi:hypothetical protein